MHQAKVVAAVLRTPHKHSGTHMCNKQCTNRMQDKHVTGAAAVAVSGATGQHRLPFSGGRCYTGC
jgi:hypothetical protein